MTPADLPIEDIHRCATAPAFLAAMDDLYQGLDEQIAFHRPVCVNRGDCCHFERVGHRLFVTSAELAYFVARSERPVRPAKPDGPCPCQRDGQCAARAQRPTGCRIFFCNPSTRGWQGPVTERTLRALRQLHDRYELPYVYVEWRAALRQVAAAARAGWGVGSEEANR